MSVAPYAIVSGPLRLISAPYAMSVAPCAISVAKFVKVYFYSKTSYNINIGIEFSFIHSESY